MSIQPDFLVARTESEFDSRRRERLALFCNLKSEDIIINQNVKSIYQVPLAFHEQEFETKLLSKLDLKDHRSNLTQWKNLVKKTLGKKKHKVKIAIVGKYFATGSYNMTDSYHALIEALNHTSINLETELELIYINSALIEKEGTKQLKGVNGIVVPIGWGARGTEGKILAIQYAREHKIPFLGLCYGMQLASVEFARNVVGLVGASSEEINPDTPYPIIHSIPFNDKYQTIKGDGTSMRLGGFDCALKKGTLAHEIYGMININERHRHRYEFNNKYRKQLEDKGFIISGTSPDNFFVEMIELSRNTHPFFLATQAHPEYKSRPLAPHPIFLAYLRATIAHLSSL